MTRSLLTTIFAILTMFISGMVTIAEAATSHEIKDIIVKTSIPLPPLAEQTRIVSKIEEVFALLDEIERELE